MKMFQKIQLSEWKSQNMYLGKKLNKLKDGSNYPFWYNPEFDHLIFQRYHIAVKLTEQLS